MQRRVARAVSTGPQHACHWCCPARAWDKEPSSSGSAVKRSRDGVGHAHDRAGRVDVLCGGDPRGAASGERRAASGERRAAAQRTLSCRCNLHARVLPQQQVVTYTKPPNPPTIAQSLYLLHPLQAFIPIGPIPRDVYEEYLEAFNRQRHVRVASREQARSRARSRRRGWQAGAQARVQAAAQPRSFRLPAKHCTQPAAQRCTESNASSKPPAPPPSGAGPAACDKGAAPGGPQEPLWPHALAQRRAAPALPAGARGWLLNSTGSLPPAALAAAAGSLRRPQLLAAAAGSLRWPPPTAAAVICQ